jgi:predicted lipoprotein with Yx(FWY)xxD motif
MKRINLNSVVLAIVAIAFLTGYGCSKKSDNNTPPSSGFAVSLATDATLGKYLVDKDGRTLYFFADDYNGRNSCSGGCQAFWPYFYAGTLTQSNLGSGLNLADFDTINVGTSKQTRYKGWPLYYYAPGGTTLEPAGKITGESVAHWFVAKPDYTIMQAYGQLVGNDGKDYLDTYVVGTGKTLYFTDAKGVTLYTFSPDSFNINKYTKSDFSNNATWPIYDTTTVVVPSNLDKTLFGSINVFGKKQLTYKGWPLYFFGPDGNIRGNNKGVSVPVPGKWPVGEKDMKTAPQK